MDGPVLTGDQTPYGPEEHITGTLTMSAAAARASYCRSALIDSLCSAADKGRRLHMRMWEKNSPAMVHFSFAAAASDKKQQHGQCTTSETWVFEMQNGITLGLNI